MSTSASDVQRAQQLLSTEQASLAEAKTLLKSSPTNLNYQRLVEARTFNVTVYQQKLQQELQNFYNDNGYSYFDIAKEQEKARLAEEARLKEEARLADEARKAELARQAQIELEAELERQAELDRLAEIERQKQEEESIFSPIEPAPNVDPFQPPPLEAGDLFQAPEPIGFGNEEVLNPMTCGVNEHLVNGICESIFSGDENVLEPLPAPLEEMPSVREEPIPSNLFPTEPEPYNAPPEEYFPPIEAPQEPIDYFSTPKQRTQQDIFGGFVGLGKKSTKKKPSRLEGLFTFESLTGFEERKQKRQEAKVADPFAFYGFSQPQSKKIKVEENPFSFKEITSISGKSPRKRSRGFSPEDIFRF